MSAPAVPRTAPTVSAPRPVARSRRRLVPAGWPLLLLFSAYPLWWLLGFGAFVWPLIAVPIAVSVLGRRPLVLPAGAGIWLLFLAWVVLSATQLDTGSRGVMFAFRLSLYLSATVVLVYVYGARRDHRFDDFAGRVLAGFWIAVVAAGFAGLLVPHLSYKSPAEFVMPRSLLSNTFVYELVHPQFAQTMDFLGYPVPRPSALFTYTNEWGSAFALLTPLAIWALPWLRSRIGAGARLIVAASLVPVLVSLNRGLWLTLSLGLLYAMVRLAGSSARRMAGRVALVVAVAVPVVALTPLRGLVVDRIETGHSDNTRAGLYDEALSRTLESPLLGYGGPRPSEVKETAPDVGTQGHLWMVLFSHGFPGAALFVGFFAYAFVRTWRPRSALGFWCHVTLLIGLLQMPVYGLLPVQIHVLMVAAALALRARDGDPSPPERLPRTQPMEARSR